MKYYLQVDELFKAGDLAYVSEEGLEYLMDELAPQTSTEWVEEMVYNSPIEIISVYVDEAAPEESLYYVNFVDDETGWEFELSPSEVSDSPLVKPELPTPKIEAVKEVVYFCTPDSNEKVGYFEQHGRELGALVDRKQKAYGNSVQQTYDVIKVLMKPYLNDNATYTIPESLLLHLLLQVRIIDKQNRIFSNPAFDLMEENTYRDISGYGMLGEKMTSR